MAHYVAEREAGGGEWQRRPRPRPRVDAFAEKVEEWVERSRGKIRADKVHERLVAMGYEGSERTTRRAVGEAKRAWRRHHGRSTRPWIPEPGLWLQWDYGTGPVIAGRETSLFCAWLAWSRFRVVLALRDRTLPSVVMALDRTLRILGGAPTYALTDNERTVTTDHVCGIAIRNPQMVSASRHYGLTVATCVPADPESKGGSEATVRIAKADLVPTDHNLRAQYESFAELEAACEAFCERVNARPQPGHPAPPGRDAGLRARAPAPAAADAPHALLRRDPQGELAGHGLGRRRDLLGALEAPRRAGLGAQRGLRARDRPRRWGRRPARGRRSGSASGRCASGSRRGPKARREGELRGAGPAGSLPAGPRARRARALPRAVGRLGLPGRSASERGRRSDT